MDAVAPNYVFYIIVAIIAVLIITSVIKKAFKLLCLVIVIVIGVSVYNVFVKGVSPTDEVKSYSADIKYGIAIKDYSGKIKYSVSNLKIATEGSIDKADINTIKQESENLKKYYEEVQALEHSNKISFFHNRYCDYLNVIVGTSDGVADVANLEDNKNIVQINNMIKKISSSLNDLSELKIE